MNAKILLLALSAAAFSSCSTVYKSGQTPDDVYYSPIRVADERKDDDKKEDERRNTVQNNTANDSRVRMVIRDRRWRDMNDEYDYDYSYRNSPYGYCHSQYNNYGYYYNPYYFTRPVYTNIYTTKVAVNSTPRMVNLSSYKNYTEAVTNAKTGTITTTKPTRQYNNTNSNNGGESRVGRAVRQILTPAQSNNTNNSNSNTNSSTNNNTRTYTPSTNSSSSGSSGSGSSSGSSSGSVARPGRG